MKILINNIDITPYVAFGGLQYSRNDVDGPNAGRALDGTMYRDRVAIKDKWTVNCKPLTASEAKIVLSAIQGEYFTCSITPHPQTGTTKTFQAYSNDVPAQYLMVKNGVEYWSGISFPIIER